jgi:hypothetical protein
MPAGDGDWINGQNFKVFGSSIKGHGQNSRVFGTSIDPTAKSFVILSVTRFYGLISNRDLFSKDFSFILA